MAKVLSNIWITGNLNNIVHSLNEHYLIHQLDELPRRLNTAEFNIDKFKTAKRSYLLIIEPHRISKRFVTISELWRRFLSQESPETKLIVLGFLGHTDNNYVDLLKLPINLSGFINTARNVSANYEIPNDGANSLDLITGIFKTHSENSLYSQIIAVKQTLDSAEATILSSPERLSEIWKELIVPIGIPEVKRLEEIWNKTLEYYGELLIYTPYWNQVMTCKPDIAKIGNIRSCQKAEEFLHIIGNIIKSIDRVYRVFRQMKTLWQSQYEKRSKSCFNN